MGGVTLQPGQRPVDAQRVVTPMPSRGDGGGSQCALDQAMSGVDSLECSEHLGATKTQRLRLTALLKQPGMSPLGANAKAMLRAWHDLSMADRESLLTVA